MSELPGGIDPSVIDLIDQLEELVSTGRRVPFTAGVVVNEDEALELIDRARLGLPDELTQARHLLEDRHRVVDEAEQESERILARAEAEAQRVVDEAGARAQAMTGEHEIAEQARAHASTVLAEAEESAAKIRAEADAYAREVMLRLEDQLMRAATTVRKGIDALPGSGEAAEETARARVARVGPRDRARRYTGCNHGPCCRACAPLPGETWHAASQATNFKAPTRLPTLAPRAHPADTGSVPALPPAPDPAPRLSELRPLPWPRSGRHRVAATQWLASHSASRDRAARPRAWRMG